MFTNSNQSHLEAAYDSLMRGIRELDLRGPTVPSSLVLNGDESFPLAMNSQGQVVMAASLYGSGRIVVLGHESYLTSLPALVENALTWLRGDGSDNLSVGIHKSAKVVADNLSASSFQTQVVGAFRANLNVGVYVTDAYSVGANTKEIVAFVKAGGGVLIGGQAWYWASVNPKKNALLCFPGNKVSGVTGIYFSTDKALAECLPVYPEIPTSWLAVATGEDFKDDWKDLFLEIPELILESDVVASEVFIHSPLAFPVGTNKDGQAFLAGAYYGQGRVIVVTHEGLLRREILAPFFKNAINWLDEGRHGVIGVLPELNDAFNLLTKSGFNCQKTNLRKDLSVFVCTAYSDAHVEEIQSFVAEGGGLLIGGHAWYWAQTNPGENPMTAFAGNKILNKMGLSLLKDIVPVGSYKAPDPNPAIINGYHFRHLLRRFAGHVKGGENLTDQEEACLTKLGVDCTAYLQMERHECFCFKQVLSTLTTIVKSSSMPQVSASSPVQTPVGRLLLHVGKEVYKKSPCPDDLLPFLIENNPLMPVVRDYTIKIDVKTAEKEEWVSTGLYLAPGMKTYIAIPAQLVNKGWKIQIGCQTDHLNHKELRRAPCVYERFPVTDEMMLVWNLWGGLLYLVVPPNTHVAGAEVKVQVAVPAPYYKSGVTTPAQWSLLRTAPSPWAELEFDNIILAVPSDVVRDLERPDLLATLWDKIMKGIADLAVIPHKFPRKERFVADVQISHGWMHCGYPIMVHSATASDLVISDPNAWKDNWGPIHELGHNQQKASWEFPPNTTECTCNLWSVYVLEEVLGIDRTKPQEGMSVEGRKLRAKKYVKGGRKLENWNGFVALETYMQLLDKFGWDTFKKVFAAYHKITDYPNDNKGKMNLYAETFSKIVGMNLAGFLKAWGWPIETATEGKLSSLPPWSDHPMVEYD
ncbi:TRPM8 channel-associated factor homolog [Genypterus blacodes]|uniref:TRPM8 channel-associated factor homolog n=1 Tax=Genypterus blacodes TaxID=154954 RepID=UPI003F76DD5A